MIAPVATPRHPAAYIRVSTERQADEGYSLDVQSDTIRQYCRLRQWPEPVLYTDAGISGYGENATKRPAWSRLMADACAGAVDAVVVVQIDRWSRDLRTILDSVLRLGASGCSFVSIVESLDFSTPIGKMALAMLGAMAQYSSDHKSVEAKRIQTALHAEGRWQWRAPYGAVLADGKLAIDPELAPTLRMILELCGQMATTQVAERLNLQGIPAPGTRMKRDRWGDMDRSMLWWSTSVDRVIAGGWWLLEQEPPYPELWLAAQAYRRPARTRHAARTWMLTGLMRCAGCGGPVVQYPHGRPGAARRRRCRCLWAGRSGRGPCANSFTYSEHYEAHVLARVAELRDPQYDEQVAITPDATALVALAEEERRIGVRYQRGLIRSDEDLDRELADIAGRRLALLPGGMGARAVLDNVSPARDRMAGLKPPEQNAILRDWIECVLIGPGGTIRIIWKPIMVRSGCVLQ